MANEARRPWERQSWETSTAFKRFQKYYLSQEPPRSVDEAYRQWYQHHTGTTPAPRKRATGHWKSWAWPKDDAGESLPTWEQRAAAWDEHVAEMARREREQRELEVIQDGYALYFERIADLKELAGLLRDEIHTEDKRWLPDVKQIGGGEYAERVDIVRFNGTLVKRYLEALDLIAEEMGERGKPETNINVTATAEATAHARAGAPVTEDELTTAVESLRQWEAQRFLGGEDVNGHGPHPPDGS